MPSKFKSTSFSRVKEFRECPLKAKLKFLDKVESPRPSLPEGQEHPMDRGSRIHELAEKLVQQGFDENVPAELEKFRGRFETLVHMYREGKVHTEKSFAFDENWKQSDYRDFENTKYRMIADIFAEIEPGHMLVIDHKTGRKDGNEPVHMQQGIEYLCCCFILYPNASKFTFEVWYLDKGDVLTVTFTRNELTPHVPKFMRRHEELWENTLFPPTPSQNACLFCDFKKGTVGRGKNAYPGTGHCTRNVN